MMKMTWKDQECFAMLGGLQAIAHAEPGTPASQLQTIAQAILDYIKPPKLIPGHDCLICKQPVEGTAEPALHPGECERAYQTWQASRAFEPEGVG